MRGTHLTKKPPSNVVEFPDAHAAIDGLLDAWLPRLIESNEILTDALLRVRDLVAVEQVGAEVEAVLERAVRGEERLLLQPFSCPDTFVHNRLNSESCPI